MKNVSKSEIRNISQYIISQMKDKRLFHYSWEDDVEDYAEFMIDIMTNHSDMTNNLIKSLVLLGDNKKYDNVGIWTYVNKHYEETVEYFNDLQFDCYIDDDEYYKELVGYSETQSDILLETIYHLTIEYELSPFERASVKCFGKNFFSGKEFDTPEYREFS